MKVGASLVVSLSALAVPMTQYNNHTSTNAQYLGAFPTVHYQVRDGKAKERTLRLENMCNNALQLISVAGVTIMPSTSAGTHLIAMLICTMHGDEA